MSALFSSSRRATSRFTPRPRVVLAPNLRCPRHRKEREVTDGCEMVFSPRSSPPDASTSHSSSSPGEEGGDERRSQSSSFTTSTSDTRTNDAPPLPGFRRGVHLYDTTNVAKAHRCNDRLEDVVQGLFEGNPLLTVPPAWRLFTQCLRSAEGEEPRDPFLYHTPKWLEAQRAREREKKHRGWFSGGG